MSRLKFWTYALLLAAVGGVVGAVMVQQFIAILTAVSP